MNTSQIIAEIWNAALGAGFEIETYGESEQWPLLGMIRGSGRTSGQNIYLSAGIHGDEPAGPMALLELLKAGSLPEEHNYFICPILNPFGLEAGIRENAEGIDLNRDYEDLASEEIRAHRAWAEKTFEKLDLGLHLHEDWESSGFYLYEARSESQPSYSNEILEAALPHVPIEPTTEIDGWPARDGIIQVSDLPQDKVGTAESGFLQLNFGSQNYTLEAPSRFPMEKRVKALKATTLATLKKLETDS